MINKPYALFAIFFVFSLFGCGPTEQQLQEYSAQTQTAMAPTLTPTPLLAVGSTLVNEIDGATMVYVPEGEFMMGNVSIFGTNDEKPARLVYLDGFWIYKTEVTNAHFSVFVNATGYQTTAEKEGWSWVTDGSVIWQERYANWQEPQGLGSSIAGKEEHPVVHISWFDAAAYCEWAGGRLPTEAEWEKTARGTDEREYPWGDQSPACNLVNNIYCGDGTSPVGSYPDGASPYGALDMAGNVVEWVADWFDQDYYNNAPDENPTGPDSGKYRVRRGGSWSSVAISPRVAERYQLKPEYSDNLTGFRCLHHETP